MKVYTDFMTSDEYFSDAKALEPVVWKNEKGEDVDTGLVRCLAVKQTAGGIKLAGVGGSGAGAGFGGEKGDAEDDGGDDGEEAEETKLDQFWNFPNIENEHTFATFASFKKDYFMPFLVTWQKCAVDKKVAADEAEMKAKGKKMANALKWFQAHFDELQFYGPESYIIDGSEVDEKHKDQTFCPNFAYTKYEGTTCYFYFCRDAFKCTTF